MSPVLNVEETNKALYHYIPELEQAKVRWEGPRQQTSTVPLHT